MHYILNPIAGFVGCKFRIKMLFCKNCKTGIHYIPLEYTKRKTIEENIPEHSITYPQIKLTDLLS